MSSLPPAFTNGNVLDASELNLMRGARNGDLTPIDESTNNEIDDALDIGTPTSRWQNGHFSGNVNADGQLRAEIQTTINQDDAPGVGVEPVLFGTENYDVGGLADLVANNDRLTVPQGGIYLLYLSWIGDGQGRWRIRHKNSADATLRTLIFWLDTRTPTTTVVAGDMTSFVLVMNADDYVNGELDAAGGATLEHEAGSTMGLVKLA